MTAFFPSFPISISYSSLCCLLHLLFTLGHEKHSLSEAFNSSFVHCLKYSIPIESDPHITSWILLFEIFFSIKYFLYINPYVEVLIPFFAVFCFYFFFFKTFSSSNRVTIYPHLFTAYYSSLSSVMSPFMLWECNVDCVSHYWTDQKSSEIAARKSINIILLGNVNFHGIKRHIHKIYNK